MSQLTGKRGKFWIYEGLKKPVKVAREWSEKQTLSLKRKQFCCVARCSCCFLYIDWHFFNCMLAYKALWILANACGWLEYMQFDSPALMGIAILLFGQNIIRLQKLSRIYRKVGNPHHFTFCRTMWKSIRLLFPEFSTCAVAKNRTNFIRCW